MLISPRMLHLVDWKIGTNVLKDHNVFTFCGKQSKKYWLLNTQNEGIMILQLNICNYLLVSKAYQPIIFECLATQVSKPQILHNHNNEGKLHCMLCSNHPPPPPQKKKIIWIFYTFGNNTDKSKLHVRWK